MKKKLTILLFSILLLPLIAIGILGYNISTDDAKLLSEAYRDVAERDLEQTESVVREFMKSTVSRYRTLCHPESLDANTLRDIPTREPSIVQYFVVNEEGQLQYPVLDETTGTEEAAFLERTAHLWKHRHPFRNTQETADEGGNRGFVTWYHNRGLHFIYWARHKDDRVVGFEVETAAFISALIAELPENTPINNLQRYHKKQTVNEQKNSHRLVKLVDEQDRDVYLFGDYTPDSKASPLASAHLPSPLSAWQLQYFASMPNTQGMWQRRTIYIFLTIGTLILAALILFAYFMLEYNRESRLARQQTSFVNQVSHELKTPLTNIRMYAELLQDHLDEDDSTEQRYIANIVNESGRLTRLIQNVLSFARSERKKLTLRLEEGIVDEQIRASMEPFQASFDRMHIQVETDLQTPQTIFFDHDILGQILTNLFSNVEKYAHQGKWMRVQSTMTEVPGGRHQVTIRVSDKGPGISNKDSRNLFLPFTRLQNGITEGVSGTGIGLTISKELAAVHGGGLTLCRTTAGACFQLTILAKRKEQRFARNPSAENTQPPPNP
ncbi:MAG: HAMP domain-containing histidine kinase [Deltaproteobacteria bacterium]|nr:HAMP domain-containing histidine kinase [Deltaproteobacteria bacterium]MBN2671361.1 HAMP domain-containing histidine kinase [Deltaproteobacteria bacterium]